MGERWGSVGASLTWQSVRVAQTLATVLNCTNPPELLSNLRQKIQSDRGRTKVSADAAHFFTGKQSTQSFSVQSVAAFLSNRTLVTGMEPAFNFFRERREGRPEREEM